MLVQNVKVKLGPMAENNTTMKTDNFQKIGPNCNENEENMSTENMLMESDGTLEMKTKLTCLILMPCRISVLLLWHLASFLNL